jgi:hypothetical protein
MRSQKRNVEVKDGSEILNLFEEGSSDAMDRNK